MVRRVIVLVMVGVLVACGAPGVIAPVNVGAPRTDVAEVVTVAATTGVPATATPTLTASPTTTLVPPTATLEPPTATLEPTQTASATATVSPTVTEAANDLPALSTTVPVPPEPTPNRPPVDKHPVRLQIPAIGLDRKPITVGLDADRVPIVPKHDVGWYKLSARPGDGENIVLWGHVLRWLDSPNISAPFARLKELQPGALIIVTTANGEIHRYRIVRQVQVRPTQVQYILPVGHERLTLVSCIGDNVIGGKEGVTKPFRLVTIAEPIR